MTDLRRDPIINVVNNGIKRGIRVAIENECFGAAVILIYSGIDAMAFLGMPESQMDVTREDFIKWSERYIHFSCKEQLTGLDLYGARCSMLHNYSVFSRLSREGKCRTIGYMNKSTPEVRYNPAVDSSLVLVSVPALAEAFFRGMDQFLIDLFSDSSRKRITEERFSYLVHELPYREKKNEP